MRKCLLWLPLIQNSFFHLPNYLYWVKSIRTNCHRWHKTVFAVCWCSLFPHTKYAFFPFLSFWYLNLGLLFVLIALTFCTLNFIAGTLRIQINYATCATIISPLGNLRKVKENGWADFSFPNLYHLFSIMLHTCSFLSCLSEGLSTVFLANGEEVIDLQISAPVLDVLGKNKIKY